MARRTPFYNEHLKANATMIDFAGWEMPLHYGSQIDEHFYVRKEAGVFDISHMTVIDLHGPDSQAYLSYLLANNIDRLSVPGKALYSCMLNQEGGIVDDLIVYRLSDEGYYRLIVNSVTRDKDIAWLQTQAQEFAVEIQENKSLAMLAIQGPKALMLIKKILTEEQSRIVSQLKPFYSVELDKCFIARTGYTGENGFEVTLPADQAIEFWDKLITVGVHPCGLAARDTLRIEAGLNLYGLDMDETVTPLESNLSWTVAFEPEDRDFIGRAALEAQKMEGVEYKLVGLVLLDKGVVRDHQKVYVNDDCVGEITSGGFSPVLQKGIGMARVPANIGARCQVAVRNKKLLAQVIKLPFIKGGKPTFIN